MVSDSLVGTPPHRRTRHDFTAAAKQPWRVGNLLACLLFNSAAAIALFVGWWGASGTDDVQTQVRWIVVGCAGVIISGVGNVGWLIEGRRHVAERQRAVMNRIPLPTPHTGEQDSRLVYVSGAKRYHRVDCLLVAGKKVRAAGESAHSKAGRTPCGVCHS